MSDTPRFDSWWNSYRSGAITADEFKEAVRGMERELAAMSPEQVHRELLASGYTEAQLDKGFEKLARDILRR